MSEPVRYRVAEVYATIQGEGAHAGTPLVLVRLQGCAVGCPWCDTKHTWPNEGGSLLTALELIAEVNRVGEGLRTVLVTGGEPAEQDLTSLAVVFDSAGYVLHLETSGTARGHMHSRAFWHWVTVSPKTNMPGGKPVLADVVRAANELKFVIGKQEHVDEAVVFLRLHTGSKMPVVSLQPLSANQKATDICVSAAMRHGFKLSLQQHKILNLP